MQPRGIDMAYMCLPIILSIRESACTIGKMVDKRNENTWQGKAPYIKQSRGATSGRRQGCPARKPDAAHQGNPV